MYICLPTSLKMSPSHSPSHAAGADPMAPAPILCRRRRSYAAGADTMPQLSLLPQPHPGAVCNYITPATLTVAMWGGGRCSLLKCQLSTGYLSLPPPPHPTPHLIAYMGAKVWALDSPPIFFFGLCFTLFSIFSYGFSLA